MSEQPLASFPDMPIDSRLAAWHGVAQDMPGWHEGLQQHAARNLGQRGLSHLVEVQTDPEPLPLSVEASPSREAIAQAFETGNKMLQRITQDSHFDALCAEKGVDPYNTDTTSYWETVETFVLARTAALRSRGQADELKLSALELVAATPNFLIHTDQIKKGDEWHNASQEDQDKSNASKEVSSQFNTRIREFATRFPNTRVSSLETALLKSANSADLVYSRLASDINNNIRRTIRGAQYEMGFGQILEAMGVNYRPSHDANEDARGIDWVIGDGTRDVMRIDIKSSLTEIDKLNSGHNGTPYHTKRDAAHNGDVVLYPLLTDAQFHDSFHISEKTAEMTAPKISAYLAQARRDR